MSGSVGEKVRKGARALCEGEEEDLYKSRDAVLTPRVCFDCFGRWRVGIPDCALWCGVLSTLTCIECIASLIPRRLRLILG